jgi:predicted phage tail component-like protein
MNTVMLGIQGCTFNGKHNNDIGIVMHSKSIQPPSKKKIKDSVPFMNGSYDFSTISSNGEPNFSEREITIVFGLPSETNEQLQKLYSTALEWLEDTNNKQQLIFDDMTDYYYMAEVEESSSFEQTMQFGLLTVKLVAYPFKTSIDYVGDDIWDTFNFEEDYAQTNQFDIINYATINIYNPSRSVSATIYCSVPMTITKDGVTYNLSSGNNTIYGFKINRLMNSIKINGTGRIKFMFRKESI